jgi:hypothetical protein
VSEKKANDGATKTEAKGKAQTVTISPPKFRVIRPRLVGDSPIMQARFSGKAMQAMKSKMLAGSTAKKGQKREARDFDADFLGAMHISADGWVGVPAAAIRNACIDVCRMVGFKMTMAKMSIFVLADGLDRIDGTPLIRLEAGEPERTEMAVRNATGVADIRVRPMWREWALTPAIRFDEDQFTLSDVLNLLARAGAQVGIGEGRAFSKESNGLGYGFFRVESVAGAAAA